MNIIQGASRLFATRSFNAKAIVLGMEMTVRMGAALRGKLLQYYSLVLRL